MFRRLVGRRVLIVVLFLSLIGILSSFFLQYRLHYEPCPLCIFQRVALVITGFIALFLIGLPTVRTAIGRCFAAAILLIPILFGIVSASRQIYLQHLPIDQVPACGPGLNFLVRNNSWSTVLSKVFQGSGECATVDKLGYLPLSIWSLLLLLLMATVIILSCCARER
ncbi:MAG: disulfide bond formation protein B [Neisseriaceae bacterium]